MHLSLIRAHHNNKIMAVRQRMSKENDGSAGSFIEGEKSIPLDDSSGRRKQQLGRLKLDWHLLFWMFASFATLYLSNFASNLLFNDRINRIMLSCSLLLLGMAVVTMAYTMSRHPRLDHTNWHSLAPVQTASATLATITGGILFIVSVWPVWWVYTLVIVPVLVMGGVSTVALFNL